MFKLIYLLLFIIIISKEKIDSKKTMLLSSFVYLMLNFFVISNYNNIFTNYISIVIFYRILLNKKTTNYYLISLIALIGILLNLTNIICFIYLLLIFILKKHVIEIINFLNRNKKIIYIIVILIYIKLLLNLNSNKIEIKTIYEFINIFTINILIMINIDKTMRNEQLFRKYKELKLYSKNNDALVTSYRSMTHENKNQLIIIKSMIPGKKKELEQYVNNLIKEDVKITNKWLNDLKYIPLSGIKNFVNYKLEKIESMGAIIEISISKDLENIYSSKIDIVNLDVFYTIIGVLLDNIIEAISESKEKLVSVIAYMDENVTNIELANTYKGKIDIKRINDCGYTTKGKEHGVGLYLVKKIIKNNKKFNLETRIEKNFFVQHLQITHPKNHLKKPNY